MRIAFIGKAAVSALVMCFGLCICSLDYELLAEQTDCYGDREFADLQISVDACASACRNKTSLFVYGRLGFSRCTPSGLCHCYCERDSKDKTCTKGRQDDEKYNLYWFKQGKQCKIMYFVKLNSFHDIFAYLPIENLPEKIRT